MWQQVAVGGGWAAAGCGMRLLCGSKVQEEAAMWKQGKGGGCYMAAR